MKKIFKKIIIYSIVFFVLLFFFVGEGEAQETVSYTNITASAGVGNTGSAYSIAWEDYDNDGHLDLWIGGDGQLYNNDGDGTFTASGECPTGGKGGVWVDADNGGYMDLKATAGGGFYDNDGDGTFTERATAANLVGNNLGTVVALDYNNDGYIDFFFPNGNTEPGNEIRENNGDGTFSTIDGGTIGLGAGEGNGECSTAGDVDNDGDIDIYYAAPYNPAYALLYYNDGYGVFTEDASGAGIAVDMSTEQPYYGPVFGDYNNDGWLDLFIGHPSSYESRLYLNDGDGTFTRQSTAAPDSDLGHARGSSWGDYDNDGDLDLLVGVDGAANKLYENNGDGSFTDVASTLGIQNGSSPTDSVSFADYDNDGDLDIYYNNGGTANVLYRNNLNDGSYLKVKVAGAGVGFSPKDGIGTRIELWNGDQTTLLAIREVSGGEGYGNSPPKIQHFGLADSWGGGNGTYMVKVKFTSGQTFTRSDVVPVDESITIGGTVLSQTIEVVEEANLGVFFTIDPDSGTAPLSGVDLTADVFGSETGDIHYYFWCNCDSTSADPGTAQGVCGGANADILDGSDPYSAVDLCSYPAAGNYTAKVIAERGSSQTEGRKSITVTSFSAGGLWGHYLDDTSSSYSEYAKLYTEGIIENINFDNFEAVLQSRVGQSSDTRTTWTGSIYSETAGTYNFHFLATGDTSAYLNIGNRGVSCDTGNEISVSDSAGAIDYNKNVYLSAGWHNIDVTFYVHSGTGSSIKLYWTPPGGTEEIIPESVLSPEAWSDRIIAIPDLSKPKEKIKFIVAGAGGRGGSININSGLYGHWKLDEIVDGDNVANSSKCQYPGDTQYMSFPEDLVSGKIGNALDFDGANDYVRTTTYSYYGPYDGRAFSSSVWFKADEQTPSGGGGMILRKESNCRGWYIILDDDGAIKLNLNIENFSGAGCSDYTSYSIVDDDEYDDDEWHHILAVADRTTDSDYMELFIDGDSKGMVSLPPSGNSRGGTLRFGGDGGAGSFDGLIDDVRIYRRILNSEEIALLAVAGDNPPNPINIVVDLAAEGISISDVVKDEVWMFAGYESDETGHRVKNNLTGGEEYISASTFTSSTGWPISLIEAKLPQSLIDDNGTGKLNIEFNLDEGQFRSDGIVLLVPYIDESADYKARLYVRTRGHSVYNRASPVYLFPVMVDETLTTDDIRPFFVFGDGETKITMAEEHYRPNYMYYVSGDVDIGENPPTDFQIVQNMPGAVRLMPEIDGPPDINNPHSWYPAFGREGPQIDVVSQNYVENQASGAVTGGGKLDLFSIPEEDDWIAFQAYGCNFPGDNVVGGGESMFMFGGGLVSVEPIEEPALPEVPTGLSASSTECETANLGWNDIDSEEYYVIQRKSGEFDFATITPSQIPQNSTFHQDTSLGGGVTYTYRIRACNDSDICSGFSNEAVVTPESCVSPSYFELESSNSIEINLSGNAEDIETSTETTITVIPYLGFSDDISLSFHSITDPLPDPPYSGVTYNFSDDVLSEAEYSSGSQFSVTLPGDVPPGSYEILLNGDGGSYSAGVSVILYVNSITPDWKEI